MPRVPARDSTALLMQDDLDCGIWRPEEVALTPPVEGSLSPCGQIDGKPDFGPSATVAPCLEETLAEGSVSPGAAQEHQAPSHSAAADVPDETGAHVQAGVVEAERPTASEPRPRDFPAHLQSMSEADLRNEFRRLNLPELNIQGPTALRERLLQWAHWTHLSIMELEAECTNLGVPPEEIADSFPAEESDEGRHRLFNLLLVYVWCIPGCSLPLQRIKNAEQILHLVLTCEGYFRLDGAGLQKEWAALGFPSDGSIPREELIARLQTILFWNVLPITEVRKECRDRGLLYEEAEGSLTRDDFLQFLYSAACPACRVPVERLPSMERALAVLQQFVLFEQMSITRMRDMLNDLNLPLQGGLEKMEYIKRFECVMMWREFSSVELEKECLELDIDVRKFLPDNKSDAGELEEHRREQLLELLLSALLGVPVNRFDSISEISEIAPQFSTLQLLTLTQLQDQCEEMNVPLCEGSVQQYIDRLQYVALYLALPTIELGRECEHWGISLPKLRLNGNGDNYREQMLEVLFCGLNDVPIDRLESLAAISSVGQQYIALQRMSLHELRRQFADWHMPAKPDASRVDLIGLLQYAVLWWELTALELEKDFKDWNIPIPFSYPRETLDEKRARLLDHLLFTVCWDAFRSLGVWVDNLDSCAAAWDVHEEFKLINAMTSVGLRARYAEASGLYADDRLGNEEIVERLKWLAYLRNLPFTALQRLCREQNVNSIARDGDKEPLIDNLIKRFWMTPRPTTPGPRTPQASKASGPFSATPPKVPSATPAHPGPGRRPAVPKPPPKTPAGAPPPKAPPKAPPPTRPARLPQSFAAHFETLGLPTTAGLDDVKRAYRRLALRVHPDKNPGDQARSAQDFLKVSGAYASLVDFLSSKP